MLTKNGKLYAVLRKTNNINSQWSRRFSLFIALKVDRQRSMIDCSNYVDDKGTKQYNPQNVVPLTTMLAILPYNWASASTKYLPVEWIRYPPFTSSDNERLSLELAQLTTQVCYESTTTTLAAIIITTQPYNTNDRKRPRYESTW